MFQSNYVLGRIEGKEEGKEEGKIEGKIEREIEIASKALKKGLSIKDISELTGLTDDQIRRINNAT